MNATIEKIRAAAAPPATTANREILTARLAHLALSSPHRALTDAEVQELASICRELDYDAVKICGACETAARLQKLVDDRRRRRDAVDAINQQIANAGHSPSAAGNFIDAKFPQRRALIEALREAEGAAV